MHVNINIRIRKEASQKRGPAKKGKQPQKKGPAKKGDPPKKRTHQKRETARKKGPSEAKKTKRVHSLESGRFFHCKSEHLCEKQIF